MSVAIEIEPKEASVEQLAVSLSEMCAAEFGGLAIGCANSCSEYESCVKRIILGLGQPTEDQEETERQSISDDSNGGTTESFDTTVSDASASTTEAGVSTSDQAQVVEPHKEAAQIEQVKTVNYRAELMDDSVEVVLAVSLRADNSKVVAESKSGNLQTDVLPTERAVKNSNPKVPSEPMESIKQTAVSDKISEIKLAGQVDKSAPSVSVSNIVESQKPEIDKSVIVDHIDTFEVDSNLVVDRPEGLRAGEYDVDEQSEAADDKKAEATEDGGEIETDNKAALYEGEEGEINIEFDDASDLGENVEIISKIDKEANSEFDDEIDNEIDPELIQDIESIFESKNFGDEEGFLGEYLRDDEVGDEGKIIEANPLFDELEFEFYLNQILSRDFSQILEENGENIVQAVEPVDGELLAIDDLEFAGRDSIDPETRKLGTGGHRRRAKGLARRLLAVRALVLSKIIFEY